MPEKKRIAILGGGPGALTAAFYLTERPNWSEQYDITVYQMGWRLGGKGASGRNAAKGNRIEEHGLHIWYGFYENAFATIRKCYEECAARGLLDGSPMTTWESAFHPQTVVTIMDDEPGGWTRWDIPVPENPLTPGDGVNLFAVWDSFVGLLRRLVDVHDRSLRGTEPVPHSKFQRLFADFTVDGEELLEPEHTLLHALLTLASRLPADVRRHPGKLKSILTALEYLQQKFLERIQSGVTNVEIRRAVMTLDVGVTILAGMIREDVLLKGFDPLNRYDFSEWLSSQGCANYWCPIVRSLYTGLFAFEGGDSNRPNLAAGVALRGMLRMFLGYKGSICWKMQAGMGDTIFAPLHLLLTARGVNFKYFHKVDQLHVGADGKSVERIDVDVQANVSAPGGYNPLQPVNGVPSWPSMPFWDQLENGSELQRQGVDFESFWDRTKVAKLTLERGRDFDDVLLGIPSCALQYHCRELMDASSAFCDMVEKTLSVPTQAVQIWLKQSAAELGWEESQGALMTGYVEPLDTWGDMSHLIPRETWPAGTVQNISYFCGALQDAPIPPPESGPGFDEQQVATVTTNASEYFNNALPGILPAVRSAAGEFNTDLMVCAPYIRANVDPHERYVLSGKGTMEYRLRPDASGFDNLYLAGDWTWSGLSAGCVEGAVMSGMHAARSMSGLPLPIAGESDEAAGENAAASA